ncbi:MAG: hypothetical protein ACYC75_03365 [Minisyncoccota bacterium]
MLLMAGAEKAHKDSVNAQLVIGMLVLILLATLSLGEGIYLGHGFAPVFSAHLSESLPGGKTYTLVGAHPDGGKNVLVIEDDEVLSDGSHPFYILRTNDPIPPTHFAMIGGKVWDIAPPK